MLSTHDAVVDHYREKLAEQEAILRRCSRRWSSMSYLRGGTFLLSLVPLFLALNSVWGITTGWLILAGLIFIAFLVVAYVHEGMQSDLKRARLLASMHRESVARCQRQWEKIHVPPTTVPRRFLANSIDLDLFGDASLFKLLAITRTPLGTETLANWIIEGAEPAEIQLRQEAVDELRSEFDWRLNFRLRCEQLATGQSGPSRFVEWSESPDWFEHRMWLLWIARIIGAITLAAIVLLVIGVLPLTWAGPTLLVTCSINFFLSVFFAGAMHDVFNQISSRTDEALHYVALFDMVTEFPAQGEKLKSLQVRLHDRQHDAQQSMHRLGWYTWLANMRRNGILFLVYLALEFLVFWDAHCLHLLESWKRKNGRHVRGWFTDLGQWEAICALAKLAGDQPSWCFPKVFACPVPQDAIVDCQQLGHPLLDDRRVCNDVQVGPPGTVKLVTGSNMSGKSTLLRSIGVNAVLAQMGSVVCAREMNMPPVHIETSMRIVDSLADGVSFFMAELKRLKEIVDTAKTFASRETHTLLFLLDEILQGTNSRERQIAVSRVVRKLIDENAIGAISTHDLDLATTDELRDACRTVHFSEQFHEVNGKRQMTFDYRMKPGIAETTNALTLLEMVGLGEDS